MSESVEITNHDPVRVLTLQNPPVNGLSAAVRGALGEALAEGLSDKTVGAFVVTGAGDMFCAGADIRELGTPKSMEPPFLPDLIGQIERSEKPVVVAIHGVAAGGGLELALGCHERLAAPGARVGLPEVTLGIIPGAGGTQRLPRLVGVEAALDVIVGGKLLAAEEAVALGVVDTLVDGDLVEAAVTRARELAARGSPPRRTSELSAAREEPALFETFEKSIAKKARGFEAPYAAIEAIRAAVDLPFAKGLQKERGIFLELVESDQAAAQRHAFFAEREAAKIPDVPRDTPALAVRKAVVVGFGTMGGGIAMAFANAGIPVTVIEADQAALDRGFDKVTKNYQSSVSKGQITAEQMDERLGSITPQLDYDAAGEADILVEAVFEELDVKKDVFRRFDQVAKPEAVLATNTSSLDVNAIASVTSRPEKVIGTHFFSPAHIMKLMENVRGEKTSKETIATVMKLSKRLGKVGVLVGVCDGFVGNRMLYAYRRQADFLLEEGALPDQVDRVVYEFGLPMGPFEMADLAGLDIGWSIRKRQAPTRPSHLRYSPIADRICELERFGQKTGAGWYRYEAGSRKPIPDPEIAALIAAVSEELGIERREISDDEIRKRCIYPLINEGAKILDEAVALRSADIDVIWLYGYGFPRYRGGPMFYADTLGVLSVYEDMKRFHDEQGEWMTPAPLLEQLARENGRFGEWHRSR